MARESSYSITQQQYNYLLPVFGIVAQNRLLERQGKHFFIGNNEDYLDALNRCKYLN